MAVFVIPPAAISTIRDRSRSRTVALLDRDHRSRTSVPGDPRVAACGRAPLTLEV